MTAVMFRRALVVCLVALIGGTALAGRPAGAAEGRPVLNWLEFGAATQEHYEISSDPQDTARMRAVPVWTDKPARFRLLMLIPFKSVAAYSIGVDAVMETFRQQNIPAEFEIWLYGNDDAIAQEAVAWAESNDVDLIMPVGSRAAAFMHETYSGGRLPVVTNSAKDPVLLGQMPDYQSGSGTNIAYTSNTVPIRLFISYLFQLLPDLKNVGVLYAESNLSAIETQVAPLHDLADSFGLTVHDVAVRDGELLEDDLIAGMGRVRLRMVNSDPGLTASAWIVTGSTSVYQRIGLINGLAGRAPVVSTLPDVVRSGDDSAAVSIGINQSTAVQLSAFYAISILTEGVDPGSLSVGVVTPPDLAINFRVARQIELRIPFRFMEAATFIYNYDGRQVRAFGQPVGFIN
ncbi:ABC transporter substrate binding protein [Thalassobaculum salexigens]|uniref:ABC transporter substrate binding protein n=1 Tax=Thalassobaculum salexigens TaxID=455360 RepID=UPI0003FEDA95|nr:ABC transporter substrate binding protein [Thalassobaculum salexigens]